MSGDQLDLDLPDERPCGYALIDLDGEETPCDRPGVSWRWYQGHEHEDTLERACIIHENPGGIRMAALVAEVRRLRASSARLREQLQHECPHGEMSWSGLDQADLDDPAKLWVCDNCGKVLDHADQHPCGHDARVPGCGGCDPGAIEFVKDDDGPWRRVDAP